ncbi:[FeFe] hydrogenase H-cluster maturation GTPase HydF [Pseudothermotoga sp. U03pept]|uniref:[FeFe] hydrogenase H-cluster maturation GTPase HydF n=1 Tax=Pseudothermotoga sp. U03pept TaxID=3447012 RepID=UPI003F089640
MNTSHAGFRKYIAIIGRRNVGKSSLINAIVGQDVAIVSDVPGTTTDPVFKTLELHPLGPVTFIDTPGLDDEGFLGEKRVERAKRALYRADAAILVVDDLPSEHEHFAADLLRQLEIPFIIAVNKFDLKNGLRKFYTHFDVPIVEVSAKTKVNIAALAQTIAKIIPKEESKTLLAHLVAEHKTVVLVVPIDTAAPRGRLIMPQVEAIRETIDCAATAVVTRDTELAQALEKVNFKVDLVVTDSQAIMRVEKIVPNNIPLTTFSILESVSKGDIKQFMESIETLKNLKDGDTVAIVEACSHIPTCDDIGRVKIPSWISEKLKVKLNYKFFAGKDFPEIEELSDCKLMIHCGGCVLNRTAFMRRMKLAKRLEIPVVNYGMLISHLHGVLERVLQPILVRK